MSGRKYKEFSCRYIGMDCDFRIRAATEDEVMTLMKEHLCRDHNIALNDIDIIGHMRTWWCDQRCYDISGLGGSGGFYWG